MFHADVCIVKVAHASSLNWDGRGGGVGRDCGLLFTYNIFKIYTLMNNLHVHPCTGICFTWL